MIEAEVHEQLRRWLRDQPDETWPHHLTLARLVARTLRQHRSVLLQTAPEPGSPPYLISALLPLLLWSGPALLVAPADLLQRLRSTELPRLLSGQRRVPPIHLGLPHADSPPGLYLCDLENWLTAALGATPLPDWPIVLLGADRLEAAAEEQLTTSLEIEDWDRLALQAPHRREMLLDQRLQLLHHLGDRPANPDDCFDLDSATLQPLLQLLGDLSHLPPPWARFADPGPACRWAHLERRLGRFSLRHRPLDLSDRLRRAWSDRPIALIGEALDPLEPRGEGIRLRLGLPEDLSAVRFGPGPTRDLQLHLPERLPLPNTPQFLPACLGELRRLLSLQAVGQGFTVLLVDDRPMRQQLASQLAADFGSRLQLERTAPDSNGILVCGWDFWLQQRPCLPQPQLLVATTLPIPSLEDPWIAARVGAYRRDRRDWFRHYLLPRALQRLQQSLASLREPQTLVALLDSRLLRRSYGQDFLAALEPYRRLQRLEPDLFHREGDPELL